MKHFPFFALALSLMSTLTACHKANDSLPEEGLFSYTINGNRYATDDASIEMDTVASKQLKSIVLSASSNSKHIIVIGFSADSCDMSDTCLPLVSADSKTWEDFLDVSFVSIYENTSWDFEQCSFTVTACDPSMQTLSGRFSASFSNNKGELLLLEDGQFNKVPYQL